MYSIDVRLYPYASKETSREPAGANIIDETHLNTPKRVQKRGPKTRIGQMSEDDVRRRCAAPTCPHQAVLGLPGAHDALRMDSPSQLEAAEEGSSLSTALTALSSPGPALPRKSRTWWCEGDPRRAAQPRDIASSSNAFPCPDESASNSPGSHHRRLSPPPCPSHRLHPSPSPLSSSPLSSS